MNNYEENHFITLTPHEITLVNGGGDLTDLINYAVGWVCGMMWLGSGAGKAPMTYMHY